MELGKNPIVRIIVPLAIFLIVGGIALTAFMNKGSAPASQPAATNPATPGQTTPAPSTAPAPGTAVEPAKTTPVAATAPAAPTPPAAPVASLTGLRVQPAAAFTATLGDLNADPKANPFNMLITLSPSGGGVESIKLSRQFDALGKNRTNEVLQRRESHNVLNVDGSTTAREIVPFAAVALRVNGQIVNLASDNAWALVDRKASATEQSATLEATVVNDDGTPVLKARRTYRLKAGRYDTELDQSIINLSPSPLRVQWFQIGPIDLPIGLIRYGGDARRVRLGHLPSISINPDLQWVNPERYSFTHPEVLGEPLDAAGYNWSPRKLWPTDESIKDGQRLAWIGLTNRYFAVNIHPLPERQPKLPGGFTDKTFTKVAEVDRVVLGRGGLTAADVKTQAITAVRLTSPEGEIAPGASMDLSMGIYAGPLSSHAFASEERLATLSLDGMIIYTFGGPCGFCTFQWLARLLRSFLGMLHDHIVFDWALAIVVLVVCVRTVLHPITKWSQTSIQRFGKQMAALAPKQKKLQEKYANDQTKLREELAKLMKEENVNYAGALGCLPMFLQTPIWIALSAMIYFTFELRHTPAFFGLFQAILPDWKFLADLAEPDHMIAFPSPISIPLLSTMMGSIDGINFLPVLMGVLFWFQQKYMTPPPTTELSPEMQSQQKIMKIMIVFMFPLAMYNAPSALVIYFLANSALGILESAMIRKQVERLDQEAEERKKLIKEGKLPPEPPKQPGFFARMQQMAANKQQQQIEEARRAQERMKRKGK